MKSILFIIAICMSSSLMAQIDSTEKFQESQSVNLHEVTLHAAAQNQQQRLVHFYKTNTAATLEDILSRLPEINMIRRGAYGMEPTIRSFSSGQINVLMDGMRIHGACTDKMDPATIYIEPSNLESVQVTTGGKGFIHGSSIGGTLNMKMQEPAITKKGDVHGQFQSGYQSINHALYESLKLNYSGNRWAALATATYRKANNYKDGDKNEVAHSAFEKINYSLSVKHMLQPNLSLKTDFIGDDAFFIGYPALTMDVGYASARIASVTVNKKYERLNAFLKEWQVKGYYNYIRHFMDDTQRPNIPMHMDMPGNSRTMGFVGIVQMRPAKKHHILWQTDIAKTRLYASMTMYPPNEAPMFMLTWPDNSRTQFGTGGTWTYTANQQFKLQLNTRVDHIVTNLTTQEAKDHVSIFSHATNGTAYTTGNISIQGMYQFHPNWRWSTTAGYAERAPTASEQYGFYLFNSNDGFDYIGNPSLKKERAIQAETNIQYSKKQHRFSFTAHLSHIQDYVMGMIDTSFSTMTPGARGVKRYTQVSDATILGFEGSSAHQLFKHFNFIQTIKYTYALTMDHEPLPGIAPFKWITSAGYSKKKFMLRTEMEASAAQKRINLLSGEDVTNGFVLLHIRTGYQFPLGQMKLHVQAGVENILNKFYHEHNDWGNVPRSGRNVYTQLILHF
ncbi:MAG: TonB-dependent receptor [Ferruginibacter sp.]|nr:TonB-dependent receptor [Ferruginibacter sp.]